MAHKEVKIDRDDIIHFLSEIELFKKLNKTSLEDLATSLTPIFVEGGTAIIQQGALDTTMYILYSGRLRVNAHTTGTKEPKETTVAEISPGQFVGEIALLTHLPRTTSVKVVRDSILLKWEEESFKQFQEKHPDEVVEIAKIALKRLATKPRATQPGENFVSIAIIPAGSSDHRHFSNKLTDELNKIKPAFLLTKEKCNQHFGKDIAEANVHDADAIRMTTWFQSLENEYGFIIYETDNEMTPWTQRCLRQADRIMFVAEDSASYELNSIEKYLLTEKKDLLPYIEIAFVHPDHLKTIRGTEKWLKDRFCSGYYHLKLNSKQHFDRIIRFLTGRAFGIVLNGGGALGFSHVGVLQALDELNIPIDFIAGSSIGAVVGAGYAHFGTSETIRSTSEYSKNWRKELTLPLVALTTGKYNVDFFQKNFNETRIEDLWIRFFCASTDLSNSDVRIHDRGVLWKALRASISLPAVFPPAYDDEGNVLVDGGILNNMPVDVMRKMIGGGKILGVRCQVTSHAINQRKFPHSWISGWRLFLHRLNPFAHEKIDYDGIFKTLMSSIYLSSTFSQKNVEKDADFILVLDTSKYTPFDFVNNDKLIEIGYRTAMEKLPPFLKGL